MKETAPKAMGRGTIKESNGDPGRKQDCHPGPNFKGFKTLPGLNYYPAGKGLRL
ncbi:MAG: hypothetical protein GX335_08075 [Firmicutes bacterium]|nr:hypothetical protein [Bacillota bacterium]